jgi:UDP-N-acetylglucosamine 2-epimerase (non-hydrolysing)
MVEVTLVLGTRPEVIKMFPLLRELKRHDVKVRLVSTGQQRELLNRSFQEFDIKPEVDLKLMTENQSAVDFFLRAQTSLNSYLQSQKPQWLLVHGDTSSAAAAALVGFFNGIRVGHVEAGLRTGNIHSPFPEEANRRMIDSVSDLHFAPTMQSFQALAAEGYSKSTYLTGNTIVDSIAIATQSSRLANEEHIKFITEGPYIFVTQHRRENFDTVLPNVLQVIQNLSQNEGIRVVWPVHPNPNVWTKVKSALSHLQNVLLIEPQDYFVNVELIRRSACVVTDSGGIQEEASILGVPLAITRLETERPEVLTLANVELVGNDMASLQKFICRHYQNQEHRNEFSFEAYGTVGVSKKIVDLILSE